MGIPVNEEANALAKGAHQQDTPVSRDVTAFDAARQQLTRLALTMHPDRRVEEDLRQTLDNTAAAAVTLE
ncbi:uncharacterized protein LOC144145105 isoform X4 [Haemaphysalis longicornis]